MATKRSVTYQERIGRSGMGSSPTESFAPDRMVMQRVMQTTWGARTGLQGMVRAIVGDCYVALSRDATGYVGPSGPSPGYSGLCRQIPDYYPEYTDPDTEDPVCWATRIDRIQGFGVPADKNMKTDGEAKLGGGAGSDLASYRYAAYSVTLRKLAL